MRSPPVFAPLTYRPDVDALRAVAVLAVFLFHLGLPGMGGGFVGVDVFYVISGFVIFRAMIRELDEGLFSPVHFYRRRLCRIFPALALTLAGCLVAGAVIMVPDDFLRLANSALSAIFSGSNIYFSDRVDYFAASVRETPLAHTWSLGIEEQFYLLTPLLVFAVTRFRSSRGLIKALAILSLLSFACNLFTVFWLRDEVQAFYLPMSRFWEIGAGGLLAWLEPRWHPRGWQRHGLAAVGMAGLVAAFLLIDETMPFPGAVALWPVAATCALIAATVPAYSLPGRVITTQPVLFIGRISYSLYLFHWPLIVFYTLYGVAALSGWEQVGILATGIVLASLSWRFVESPFRGAHRRRGRPLAEVKLGVVALVLTLAYLAVSLGSGLPQRLSPHAQAIAAEAATVNVNPKGCHRIERLPPVPNGHLCTYTQNKEHFAYLLWGDSHARVLSKGLQQTTAAPGINLYMSACPSLLGVYFSESNNRAYCLANQKRALELVQTEHIPTIILMSRWAVVASAEPSPGDGAQPWTLHDAATGTKISFADALTRTIDQLRAAGAHVIIVGPVPEAPFDVPKTMIRSAHRELPFPSNSRAVFDRRQAQVLAAFQQLRGTPGVDVVLPHERLCDARTCRMADGATPLYADDDHLSLPGALLISLEIADILSQRQPKMR